jgi:hypothetical protein
MKPSVFIGNDNAAIGAKMVDDAVICIVRRHSHSFFHRVWDGNFQHQTTEIRDSIWGSLWCTSDESKFHRT